MQQITLESARVNAGYSIIDVSKKVNKTVKTIYNWENGRTAISAQMFFELCKIYNVNSDFVRVPIVKDGKY